MPKYNHVNNIPAKLFFDILQNKDFELLEPNESELKEIEELLKSIGTEKVLKNPLEECFGSIYDDYFVQSENPKAKEFLELRQTIFFMEHKIKSIVQVLDFLLFNDTPKEIRIILLQALIDIGVNIDLENSFIEEVKNILQVELGIIYNDVNLAKMDLENMNTQSQESVFNFYEHLVGLESAHERSLDDEMVLAKFIVYEKITIQKANRQKQKEAKFNTH